MSLANRAQVRMPTGSTRSPGRLWPMHKGPRGQPAVPGDSGTCPRSLGRRALPGDSGPFPRACGVDQLSQVTRACFKWPSGSTSSHGPLVLESEGQLGRPGVRGRPAVSGDSGPWSRASGVNQLSQVTRVQVRCPAGSSRCPGRIGPVPKAPQCKPNIPGDSGPAPRTCGVETLSRASGVRV